VSAPNLSNYVEVNERIAAFKSQHPDGCLQSEWEIVEVAGHTYIVVKAYAYRTPDDERPGIGTAWEPYPGKTPYTKQSELMVGETSAWGRAIAALGFEVHRGVASREEVRSASERRSAPPTTTPKQAKRKTLADVLIKTFNKDADAIGEFIKEETGKDSTKELTIEEMDRLIAEMTNA
jgi:hypothetical protein